MRILLTGASGFVGGHLWPCLAERGPIVTLGRRAVANASTEASHLTGDLEDDGILELAARSEPEAVVHLAALTDPELCEAEPGRAERVNADASERLASTVAKSCRRFLQVSTDLIFDGERGNYDESDEPRPISVYGRTKLEGERRVRSVLGDRATVVRLALVYGVRPHGGARESFLERMLRSAASGSRVALFTDEIRTPLFVEDAALALLRLLELDSVPPLVHLGGNDRVSRYEMGVRALSTFGIDRRLADARLRSEGDARAPRPRDVSLSSSRARALGLAARGLEEGLETMKRAMAVAGFMVGS